MDNVISKKDLREILRDLYRTAHGVNPARHAELRAVGQRLVAKLEKSDPKNAWINELKRAVKEPK